MDLFTMIHKKANDEVLELLSKVNINIRNKSKMSLLHAAIAHKNNETGVELIKRGIDLGSKDDRGQTVLHYVGVYNNQKLGELILQKYPGLSEKDNYGNTPLWYATFNARGNYETVILFMRNGADPYDKNNNNKTPLDFARQIEDNKLINILLEHS